MKIITLFIGLVFLGTGLFYASQGEEDFLNRAAKRIVTGRSNLPETLSECADLFERSVSPDNSNSPLIREQKQLAKRLFGKLRHVPQDEQEQTKKDLEWGFFAFQYKLTRWAAVMRLASEIEKYKQELMKQQTQADISYSNTSNNLGKTGSDAK